MGISSQLASARLIQPGVCTSSTRPASPFQGQCIYETDTNRLYVWNGSAWVIPNQTTQNPEGLELVKTATISSASTSIDNCFSATYDNYKVVVTIESYSTTGQTTISMRLRSGGSDNTASSYNYGWLLCDSGGTANLGGNGQTSWAIGLYYQSAGTAISDMTVSNPYRSGITTAFTGTSGHYYSAGSRANMHGGSHYVSASFDGLTVFTSASCTGSIRVYGLRNS